MLIYNRFIVLLALAGLVAMFHDGFTRPKDHIIGARVVDAEDEGARGARDAVEEDALERGDRREPVHVVQVEVREDRHRRRIPREGAVGLVRLGDEKRRSRFSGHTVTRSDGVTV